MQGFDKDQGIPDSVPSEDQTQSDILEGMVLNHSTSFESNQTTSSEEQESLNI